MHKYQRSARENLPNRTHLLHQQRCRKVRKEQLHFYLLQNVGALLENDQQQGLAHFLEHMAFNSTKHYPQGVMTWLRQRGLYDFDARTGQDETRFSISEVPTAVPGLTDSVMMVLRDWWRRSEHHRQRHRERARHRHRRMASAQHVSKRLSDSIASVVYNNSPICGAQRHRSASLFRDTDSQRCAAFLPHLVSSRPSVCCHCGRH